MACRVSLLCTLPCSKDQCFVQAYTGQEAPEALLAALAALKASAQQRERQVAACMIHNLFDEYRFFAKYPDKELAITAALFGGLVQRNLVAGRWLDLALRYLLVRLQAAVPPSCINSMPGRSSSRICSSMSAMPQHIMAGRWLDLALHCAASMQPA